MFHHITVIASYTVLEAIRNRLVWLLGFLILLALGAALFTGSLTLTETNRYQLSISAWLLRSGAVFIAALSVISGTIRDYHDKNHELVLATSLTRSGFYLGRLAGYLLIAGVIGLLTALPLLLFASPSNTLFWALSLILEISIVSCAALVVALVIGNFSIAVLAIAGFYLLARIMPAISQIAHSPAVDQEALSTLLIGGFIGLLDYLLPNLGQFALADLLIKETTGLALLGWQLLQALIYIAMLSMVALIDFNRKNI